ncbi:hypothetical protein [Natranaeroarchaeum aerophilus]|uniref:Domain of unknown function domain-containing protein n=1 Tax=Natranaeroarchaeum aerophilus TaxID=2917711 RepID=A0AAE3FN69_9EURY|nr:hypothetical protein [Natranaeroarchaeum aerophilus]MCL9812597.1 hypothetical protein [Natranaeroarchaeum aerophilus]
MIDEDNQPDTSEEIMGDRGRYINPRLFDLDRPRGILSKTDREYLVGNREYEHKQSELNRKQEIRKRIKNGLQDFELLENYLDVDQREKVFEDFDEDELDHYVTSLISYLYKSSEGDAEWLKENVRTGVFRGIATNEKGAMLGDIKSVSVDINIEYEPDVAQIYKKFTQSNEEPLTPEEIGLLVRHGKLSEADIEELDRSDPMETPVKLERMMEMRKQMIKESDEMELIEEDLQDKNNRE